MRSASVSTIVVAIPTIILSFQLLQSTSSLPIVQVCSAPCANPEAQGTPSDPDAIKAPLRSNRLLVMVFFFELSMLISPASLLELGSSPV